MKLNLDAKPPNGEDELEQALAALRSRGLNPHRSGDGWISKCPTHEDHRQSLSLGVGDKGKLVLKCHANQGCSFPKLIAALGIDAKGDGAAGARPSVPQTPSTEKKRHTVAKPGDALPRGHTLDEAYAYTDEHGETLYLILRLKPKTFRVRAPAPDGRWHTDLADTRRVLYDLQLVIAAVAAGDTVYVVEGEKAAERVKQEGVVATTKANGALKEWTPELIAPLADAHVIIVADCDDPGRESARALAAALDGIAASVQLRESATGVDKDGADDHLDAGHPLAALAPIAEMFGTDNKPSIEQPLVTDTPESVSSDDEPDDAPPGADGIQLLDLAALLANPPPDPDYDWHGYLERGTLAVLHGDGGLGKSLVGMGLCRRYTLGKEWLGQDTAGGFALYLDGENSLAEIARRLYAFEVRGSERKLRYGRVDMQILRDPIAGEAILEHWVRKTCCELLVLDSQRALWGGDEREQMEVRPMYQMLAALAERLTVSILLIHHDNKSGAYSGSTDINAAVTSRLHLERRNAKNKKDRKRVIWHEKNRSGPEVEPVTFSVDKTPEGVLTFAIHHDEDPDEAPGRTPVQRDDMRERIIAILADRVPRTRPEVALALGVDSTNGTLRRAWGILTEDGSLASTDRRTFTLA